MRVTPGDVGGQRIVRHEPARLVIPGPIEDGVLVVTDDAAWFVVAQPWFAFWRRKARRLGQLVAMTCRVQGRGLVMEAPEKSWVELPDADAGAIEELRTLLDRKESPSRGAQPRGEAPAQRGTFATRKVIYSGRFERVLDGASDELLAAEDLECLVTATVRWGELSSSTMALGRAADGRWVFAEYGAVESGPLTTTCVVAPSFASLWCGALGESERDRIVEAMSRDLYEELLVILDTAVEAGERRAEAVLREIQLQR